MRQIYAVQYWPVLDDQNPHVYIALNIGLIPLHFGYTEQPQKSPPALAPLRATLITICFLQNGHAGGAGLIGAGITGTAFCALSTTAITIGG